MGPHQCAGRAIAITLLTAMTKVCAQLKNLRRAPGDQGQLKYIPGPLPGTRKYLTDDWSRFQPTAGGKSKPHLISIAVASRISNANVSWFSLESTFRRLSYLSWEI